MSQLIEEVNKFASEIHVNAMDKGFWKIGDNKGEKLCLIHSEISEALESIRKGEPPDSHCPEFSSTEVELADAMIRILDFGYYHGLRIIEAAVAKHNYNKTRKFLHGKKF